MFLFTLHNCNIFLNIIHVTFLILEFTLEICTEQSLPDLLLSTVNLQDKTDHPITRYCIIQFNNNNSHTLETHVVFLSFSSSVSLFVCEFIGTLDAIILVQQNISLD